MNTQIFFMEQLVNEMKPEEETEVEEIIDLPELPITDKTKSSDIDDEIKEVVHNTYEYDDYSKLDGSNDRFIRKQENTNQLRDVIFDNINTTEAPTDKPKNTLFKDEDFIF